MKKIVNNLRLVAFESVVTAGLLCMPIMTPFFNSIGLNQEQIALCEMAFTIVVIVLNIPAGWLADRFSRKWANVIGDLGCALALVLYSQVQDFTGAVICETLFGLFLAFSQGVDSSLLRHFSGKVDSSGKLFKTTTAKVASAQYLCTLALMLLGGPIGAISFRLAIVLSAITFLAGAIAAIFVADDSENLVQKFKSPLKDMGEVAASALRNPALRLRIMAFAVARELTHGIVWVFTPLLLLAGVPLAVVSVGWAANSVAGFIGSKIAQKYVNRLREWQVFAVPLALVLVSLGTMSLHFGLTTIWLYLLMGIAQGWVSATMLPLVQHHAKPSEQTSVVSIARVAAQLLYIPAVWLIGVAADIKIEYSMLATLAIFVPLGIPILVKLRREK
ncbi:MAG: MFS transporter [Candidatus Nomurabacteria bacterium]|jgi:MFS family permease|nr:MFS transporter [Candidatus Nomurabacteria bacterium]